ncbi:hypothetical protein PHMEG_00014004 [Phytophthora megakarya]|uniref:Uncharacterized protein n=1 Tax=Phytophthora megakarya TaxID=4795 RepID=A0A225W7F7_9STRA|nr:hypothetical protein PHMEG_00014004 [Phytophthora megakarya]
METLHERLSALILQHGRVWMKDSVRPVEQHPDHSLDTGETRIISLKQFRRLMKKPQEIAFVLVIKTTEVPQATRAKDIEEYKDHPVYPYLCKYPSLFKQKLPAELPPVEHGLHKMKVNCGGSHQLKKPKLLDGFARWKQSGTFAAQPLLMEHPLFVSASRMAGE